MLHVCGWWQLSLVDAAVAVVVVVAQLGKFYLLKMVLSELTVNFISLGFYFFAKFFFCYGGKSDTFAVQSLLLHSLLAIYCADSKSCSIMIEIFVFLRSHELLANWLWLMAGWTWQANWFAVQNVWTRWECVILHADSASIGIKEHSKSFNKWEIPNIGK